MPARSGAQFVPDAQYLAEAAQRQFDQTTRLNEIQAENEAQRNATQEALRQILGAAPEERSQVQQSARQQGLFYSGILGKRLGDLESNIASRRAQVQSQFDAGQAAREAARAAIMQGAPLEEAAAKAAAIERQLGRDTEAANNNALAPTPQPKAKPKAKPAATKPKKSNRQTYKPDRQKRRKAGLRAAR